MVRTTLYNTSLGSMTAKLGGFITWFPGYCAARFRRSAMILGAPKLRATARSAPLPPSAASSPGTLLRTRTPKNWSRTPMVLDCNLKPCKPCKPQHIFDSSGCNLKPCKPFSPPTYFKFQWPRLCATASRQLKPAGGSSRAAGRRSATSSKSESRKG